jgi:O-antigen ligase
VQAANVVPSMSADASTTRPAVANNDRLIRNALFLATFLLTWLTAAPFPELGDPDTADSSDGNLFGQVLTLLSTGALAAFAVSRNARIVLKAFTPLLALTLAWFAVSAVMSAHPELAGRRLVLAVFTIFAAAVFLLLPEDRQHFGRLLAVGSLIVLAVCYAGVLFIPDRAIHQFGDLMENDLAGAWRGAFGHKNGAGASMVVLIFIGIYVSRTFNLGVGLLIVALSAVFLVFSMAKSPLRLLPLVLLIAFMVDWLRSPSLKLVLIAGVPLAINVMSVGSVYFEAIATMLAGIISDPSYTGRDVIWLFTFDQIAQRPIVGFGFQAFWGTSALADGSIEESWGYRASDAHNAFLNVAVMTGVVGLALSLLWIVAQPFADYVRGRSTRPDPALTMLFLQVWLFGLLLSAFESVLFSGGSSLWFMMIVAIVGFRYQLTARPAR